MVLGSPPWCLTTALPSLQAHLHGLSQGELGLAGRAAVDQDSAHDIGGRDGLHVLCDWQLGLLLATEGEGEGSVPSCLPVLGQTLPITTEPTGPVPSGPAC